MNEAAPLTLADLQAAIDKIRAIGPIEAVSGVYVRQCFHDMTAEVCRERFLVWRRWLPHDLRFHVYEHGDDLKGVGLLCKAAPLPLDYSICWRLVREQASVFEDQEFCDACLRQLMRL